MYTLITELLRALEDPQSRVGALKLTAFLLQRCWSAVAEYTANLLSAVLPLMAEDAGEVPALLQPVLKGFRSSIAKEDMPNFVR